MSTFSRIKVEHTDLMVEAALSKGLEHQILPFPGDKYSDWVTFQFTTENSKRAFENLCKEHDVTVDGQQLVHSMLDDVVAGEHPKRVIEGCIDKKMTPGMLKSYNRQHRIKYRCKNSDCGNVIGTYTGAYPRKCPDCGGELAAAEK